MASLYENIRKKINNNGAFSLAQKRVLREVSRLTADAQPSAAVQAVPSFQAGADFYNISTEENGARITTRIFIDIDGLNSGGVGDVIGVNGSTDPAYIAVWDEEEMGTFLQATLRTYETPAGGDADIDIVMSATGTTAEDNPPTAGTTVLNSAGIAEGDVDVIGQSTWETASPYIYLVGATGADATYVAGKLELIIEGYRQ